MIYNMGMSSDAGVVALKNLALLCVCAGVVILIGYLAYSQTGCSLVCQDGNGTSELAFVIEGDLDPSDQMLRVSVSGYDADANTEVTINNMTYSVKAQSKIPVKYTRRLLFFAPSRLCVFALLFSNLTQRRKGAETQRVLPISIFASFALLHIQLTITEITGFPDSAFRKHV